MYIMVIPQKAKNILFSENVFLSFPPVCVRTRTGRRKRESIFYFSLLDSHFRGNDRDKSENYFLFSIFYIIFRRNYYEENFFVCAYLYVLVFLPLCFNGGGSPYRS